MWSKRGLINSFNCVFHTEIWGHIRSKVPEADHVSFCLAQVRFSIYLNFLCLHTCTQHLLTHICETYHTCECTYLVGVWSLLSFCLPPEFSPNPEKKRLQYHHQQWRQIRIILALCTRGRLQHDIWGEDFLTDVIQVLLKVLYLIHRPTFVCWWLCFRSIQW